jgi:hypothetical protein
MRSHDISDFHADDAANTPRTAWFCHESELAEAAAERP